MSGKSDKEIAAEILIAAAFKTVHEAVKDCDKS